MVGPLANPVNDICLPLKKYGDLKSLAAAAMFLLFFEIHKTGADPGFQVREAHLKKLRWAEGGAKIFGVFVWKITILRHKNLIFSNYRGAPPPPESAPAKEVFGV